MESMNFKAGDSAVCIEKGCYPLSEGKTYTITDTYKFSESGNLFVIVTGDEGDKVRCYASRFKKADGPKDTFAPGDIIRNVSDHTIDVTIGKTYTVIGCDDGDVEFRDDVGDRRSRPAPSYEKVNPVRLTVGDRVRYIGSNVKPQGLIGTIVTDDHSTVPYLVRFDGFDQGYGDDDAHWWCHTGEVEAIPSERPKVGQRVQVNPEPLVVTDREPKLTVGDKVQVLASVDDGQWAGRPFTIQQDEGSLEQNLGLLDDRGNVYWFSAHEIYPAPEEPKRPQVGQWVKVINDDVGFLGRVGILERDDMSSLPFLVRFQDTGTDWFYEDDLEVVEAPKADELRRFQVGDLVVGTGHFWSEKGVLGVVVDDDGDKYEPFQVRWESGSFGGTYYVDPEDLELRPAPTVSNDNPTATQVGGTHYSDMTIQPIDFILANSIPFSEGSVIKYVSRWKSKGGVEDLKKARHLLDMLIAYEEREAA